MLKLILLIVFAIQLSTSAANVTTRCDNNENNNHVTPSIAYPNLQKRSFSLNPVFAFLKALGARRAKQMYDNIRHGVKNAFTCYSCEMVMSLTKLSVYSVGELNYLMAGVCESFRFEDRRVCSGLSDLFSEQLYYILRHTNLTKSQLCATLIGAECLSKPCADRHEWLIELDTNYTTVPVVNTDPQIYRMLHLSDLHIDPYYSPGAHSDCGEPLCCRASSAKGKTTAGHWGDYQACDSPKYTIEKLMSYINATFPADHYRYVIWTGDITAHDVWNTTRDTIVNGSRALTSLITTYIAPGRLVFPVVGNHEGLPVNQFPPPDIKGLLSNDWLYRELLAQWSQWIPEEYHQMFRTYGCYARQVSKLFKVVVLNTNYCARINFWLMYNPNDPGQQLKWLVRELAAAEASGQSVHIIGHIPPDNTQCISQFVHNYLRIVQRYNETIKGQFFGHTHFDEFRVMYAPNNASVPTGVAYLAPSVTPYEKVNPAFRFYTVDSAGTILDHQNYYTNLTYSNIHSQVAPVWTVGYTAKQAYNMSSMAPQEWHRLYSRMKADDHLFQSFYTNYHRYSDAFDANCTQDLKQQILNDIPIYNPIYCENSGEYF